MTGSVSGLAVAFFGMAAGLAAWALTSEWSLILDAAAWFFVAVLALFGLAGLSDSIHKKPDSQEENAGTDIGGLTALCSDSA